MNDEAVLSPRRAIIVWLLLVALTISTFWLGTHHPYDGDDARIASVVVIVLAFVKVWFIVADFMEVRNAPSALRIAFGIWFVVIGGAIIVLNVF